MVVVVVDIWLFGKKKNSGTVTRQENSLALNSVGSGFYNVKNACPVIRNWNWCDFLSTTGSRFGTGTGDDFFQVNFSKTARKWKGVSELIEKKIQKAAKASGFCLVCDEKIIYEEKFITFYQSSKTLYLHVKCIPQTIMDLTELFSQQEIGTCH